MPQGTLYLIPVPIAEGALETLSAEIAGHTLQITHYFVEHIRSARRFLKALHPSIVIDNLQFSEMDKHEGPDLKTLRDWLKAGHDIGVMSESGCPGIADPGAVVVAAARQAGARIVPLTGPNSLILALMASGLNGQRFCFHGYLPVKEPLRGQAIRQLEQESKKENQTQLFIETPYRNDHLLQDLLRICLPGTRLCIARNMTAPDAFIQTRTVAAWQKDKPVLGKLPAVFLLLA